MSDAMTGEGPKCPKHGVYAGFSMSGPNDFVGRYSCWLCDDERATDHPGGEPTP